MATLTPNYTNWSALTITALTTTLAADEWCDSTIVDNTTNKYYDAQVGGSIVTGASHTTGDTLEIYGYWNYDTATSTDLIGGIGALLDGSDSEETEGTDFAFENLVHLHSVIADQASKTFHFGFSFISRAGLIALPQKWGLIFHNNGTGAMGSGSTCGFVGIKHDSA